MILGACAKKKKKKAASYFKRQETLVKIVQMTFTSDFHAPL
jgi:hypothetical protein